MKVLVAFAAFLFSINALCAQVANLSDLATSLTGLRDACSKQAQDAHDSFSEAQYKASLDSQLAEQKADMDARVYGVGHGDRETREYLLDRMQQNAQDDAAKSKQIADKLASDTQQVQTCVKNAERQGKGLYSSFKAKHKHSASNAESLVTAWLTNLDEITTDHPNGSDPTDAAWKTAKAHAELSGL